MTLNGKRSKNNGNFSNRMNEISVCNKQSNFVCKEGVGFCVTLLGGVIRLVALNGGCVTAKPSTSLN